MSLISIESAIYTKRMVRVINKLLRSGKSVYAKSHPFNEKVISVSSGYQSGWLQVRCQDKIHRKYSTTQFYDANNQQIVASREVKMW